LTQLRRCHNCGDSKKKELHAAVLGQYCTLTYRPQIAGVLMALLFVGGVMNVLWIGLLALFILLEKVTPWARIANLAGVLFVAAGAWFLSPGIF
jgi:predicted metal-binding membrane protein